MSKFLTKFFCGKTGIIKEKENCELETKKLCKQCDKEEIKVEADEQSNDKI